MKYSSRLNCSDQYKILVSYYPKFLTFLRHGIQSDFVFKMSNFFKKNLHFFRVLFILVAFVIVNLLTVNIYVNTWVFIVKTADSAVIILPAKKHFDWPKILRDISVCILEKNLSSKCSVLDRKVVVLLNLKNVRNGAKKFKKCSRI